MKGNLRIKVIILAMIDFNKMVDNYVRREQRQKTIGRYYPSEIGICMRKLWYSYRFPGETQPDLLKIFEVGNIMHDFVVRVLQSRKTPDIELVKSEFPLRFDGEDFIVSGRVDNLILIKSSGQEVLVEVKSVADVSYVSEAAHHNKMQLQLYMFITGIKHGILLYLDKKNLQSKVFTVEYDEEETKRIIARFGELHGYLKIGKLPDAEGRRSVESTWMCKFCEFRERCYAATPMSKEWL